MLRFLNYKGCPNEVNQINYVPCAPFTIIGIGIMILASEDTFQRILLAMTLVPTFMSMPIMIQF